MQKKQSVYYEQFTTQLKAYAQTLGFQALKITHTKLPEPAYEHFKQWIANHSHASMSYMAQYDTRRLEPDLLLPEVKSIISVRLPYWSEDGMDAKEVLNHPHLAYVSRYALGRDYHKVLKKKLTLLTQWIQTQHPDQIARSFTDSAPFAEVSYASQAGLGWRGKHSLLLNKESGSLYFLGEILTSLDLPIDEAGANHCGSCTSCIDVCPTNAITKPYYVEASRCISYLTIEHPGAIEESLRPLIGNRIYGCDDCQLFCPWNRFAQTSKDIDFSIRNELDRSDLMSLWRWSEEDFLHKMQGSPIYRIGYAKWLSNIATAIGNAPYDEGYIKALTEKSLIGIEWVEELVDWAIKQQSQKALN